MRISGMEWYCKMFQLYEMVTFWSMCIFRHHRYFNRSRNTPTKFSEELSKDGDIATVFRIPRWRQLPSLILFNYWCVFITGAFYIEMATISPNLMTFSLNPWWQQPSSCSLFAQNISDNTNAFYIEVASFLPTLMGIGDNWWIGNSSPKFKISAAAISNSDQFSNQFSDLKRLKVSGAKRMRIGERCLWLNSQFSDRGSETMTTAVSCPLTTYGN